MTDGPPGAAMQGHEGGHRAGRDVVVLGEVLVDLFPTAGGPPGVIALAGRFGGSPANVAIGLARLECSVGFAGRLARGGYGPWLRHHLEAERVELGLSVDADEPCTLAVVTLDASGTATYELYGPGSADWAWTDAELPDPSTLAGSCVHTGSLTTALAPGADAVLAWLGRLRRRGDVVISYDPNIRPSLLGDADLAAIVAPALRCAHLVKVSEEDLAALEPGAPTGDVARSWLAPAGTATGPVLVVVTAGADGATAWHRDGRRLHLPAPPVTVVDTVGAGDAFSAGLLSSLSASGVLSPDGLAAIRDDTLRLALERAVRVAAITCARAGADPPGLADLPTAAADQGR